MDFKKSHQHTFWGDVTPDESCHFELTPHTSELSQIDVVASVQGDCLQLSYFIQGDWVKNEFRSSHLIQADFLWEKNCLECFFDLGQDEYFELNFTPTGEYNLYHFDSYRTPDTLPPVQADGVVFVADGGSILDYHVYHLGIKLHNVRTLSIHKIHPTAILYHDGKPTFYAVSHANPPDFHDKNFWQNFH